MIILALKIPKFDKIRASDNPSVENSKIKVSDDRNVTRGPGPGPSVFRFIGSPAHSSTELAENSRRSRCSARKSPASWQTRKNRGQIATLNTLARVETCNRRQSNAGWPFLILTKLLGSRLREMFSSVPPSFVSFRKSNCSSQFRAINQM